MSTSLFTGAGGESLGILLLLAKATVILVAALGITVAMQRSAAGARHLVWLVAIAAILALPLLSSWSPLRMEVLPASLAPRVTLVAPQPAAPPVARDLATDGARASALGARAADREASAPFAPDPAASEAPRRAALSVGAWIGIVWASVALGLAGWLAYGARSVQRIVRRARVLDASDWLGPLWEISDRLGLEEPPRLLRSADAKMPFACGLGKATIVLPAECDGWALDRRRAVLLHELAHVRRRDLAGHTLGRLACVVYWFHPLVWTAARRLRSESERACDDLALTSGARASDYAEHLLDIVTCVGRHTTPAVAMAMARRKEFEGRMLAILDPELRRAAPNRREALGLAGGLAVLSIVVGAAAPARAAGEPRVMTAAESVAGPSSVGTTLNDQPPAETLRTETPRTAGASRSDNRAQPKDASPVRRGPQDSAEVEREQFDRAWDSARVAAGARSAEQLAAIATAQGRGDERSTLLAGVLRSDTSASLRRIAAWGLSNYADRTVAAEALANAVQRDADASVREMAAWALANGDDGRTSVIEALSSAVRRDANVKVRATAAWALGNIGDRDALPALADALGDTSVAVRRRAAWAIGSVGPAEAPAALIALLRDRAAEVRQVAAWALFNVQDPKAVDPLDAALQGEADKDVQHALIRALAATGEASVDAIRRLIDSKDPEIRSIAIRALAGGGATGPWPWPWPDPRPHGY